MNWFERHADTGWALLTCLFAIVMIMLIVGSLTPAQSANEPSISNVPLGIAVIDPTVINYSHDVQIVYNATPYGQFNISVCGFVEEGEEDWLTPSFVGVIMRGQRYILLQNETANITGQLPGCQVTLVNLSYIPILHSSTLVFNMLPPGVTQNRSVALSNTVNVVVSNGITTTVTTTSTTSSVHTTFTTYPSTVYTTTVKMNQTKKNAAILGWTPSLLEFGLMFVASIILGIGAVYLIGKHRA